MTLHILSQSSRTQHPSDVEILFRTYLQQVREYMVVYAVQKTHDQMGRAMFYHIEMQALPSDQSQPVRLPRINWSPSVRVD